MEEALNVQCTKDATVRIKTGVKGLDEMINGGVPKNSFVVVAGGPGSGKTIFGMQFIASAIQRGEKAIYISAEQPHNEINEQALQFGWDFPAWEQKGLLRVICLDSQDLFEGNKIKELNNYLHSDHYDVGVIDSTTSITNRPTSVSTLIEGARTGIQPNTFNEMNRVTFMSLIDIFKQKGITVFGLAQKIEGMPGDTLDMMSEFISDGLINLDAVEVGGSLNRTIRVKKLRKTKIDGLTYTFEFTPTGIVVRHIEV